MFLTGEAGIGKTTLIERFTLDQRETRVWWGGCELLFTSRPLGPLRDIAAQSHHDWFTHFEAQSDRADGDTTAQTARLAIFERLGAKPAIDDVRQRLRTAGVTRAASLTPRSFNSTSRPMPTRCSA